MTSPDAVIIGGGVIGLSVAYALAREGVMATLLDQGDVGRAASPRGVRIRSGLAASGFEVVGDRVAAVRTAEGPLACGWAVVAAGPWSARLLEGVGLSLPTPPIKGQIVLLRGERPLLRRI